MYEKKLKIIKLHKKYTYDYCELNNVNNVNVF